MGENERIRRGLSGENERIRRGLSGWLSISVATRVSCGISLETSRHKMNEQGEEIYFWPFSLGFSTASRVNRDHCGILKILKKEPFMGTNPVVGFCEWRHFSVKNFSRLATAFDRYAMTREINDGLLAPRFAPGQRGYVQAGLRVSVTPAVPASAGQDSDNR